MKAKNILLRMAILSTSGLTYKISSELAVMKKASVICIGNELLNGQTINSNAAYLGRKLVENSVEVLGYYTIGDDIDT